LWRLLHDSAGRAEEALGLDVPDLDIGSRQVGRMADLRGPEPDAFWAKLGDGVDRRVIGERWLARYRIVVPQRLEDRRRGGLILRGDLNTQTGEISPVRGNHEVRIAGKIPRTPGIHVLRHHAVRWLPGL
jgi:hypothetical protein